MAFTSYTSFTSRLRASCALQIQCRCHLGVLLASSVRVQRTAGSASNYKYTLLPPFHGKRNTGKSVTRCANTDGS